MHKDLREHRENPVYMRYTEQYTVYYNGSVPTTQRRSQSVDFPSVGTTENKLILCSTSRSRLSISLWLVRQQ